MASARTQRFHIGTAKQVVDTALGEIAPEDAEKLWVSLVQSQIVALSYSITFYSGLRGEFKGVLDPMILSWFSHYKGLDNEH